MAYPKIVAKKIRMCARFGHLPEAEKSRHVLRAWTTYYCRRCGENVPRPKRGAAGMIHTILDACGGLFLLSLMIVFAFGAWMIATGERRDRYAPVMPEPEPNLPLSNAMRDAIRRDVSAAIDRDARTAWACRVMAFHASGHGVRKATVDELMPCVVEGDR